ncbi:MAG TPA: peptidylprolyl isomerase [Verrucomicrobiae bacterium]|nr:peptidylprolyl isomerase [Verrucomicrobiae bacterium]
MIRGRAMPRGVRVAALVLPVLLAGAARAEITNRIVATIDGEPVTAHELRQYAKEHAAPGTPDARVLEALITDKLLEKEIKAQGITAREDEIDRYVEEIQQRNGMDKERFEAALAAQGLSLETYRARVKSEIEKAALVNREIRQHVNVSPEEIRRYYDAHLDDYATVERVKVRDIFLAIEDPADEASVARARAKALEVRTLALDGHDFGALAEQFSEGPGAHKGGELGTFGRGEMEHDLESATFALEPGRVSEPVRAGGGFHLLRVEQRIGAGHKPLDEVQDEIRETLYNQALEDRFREWLSHDLRERHHVEVLD